jgi:Lytic transglycolase
MFRGALGRAGVLVFVVVSLAPFVGPSPSGDVRPISVAAAFPTATVESPGQAPDRVRDVARAEVVLGVQSTPVATVELAPAATPEPTPEPTTAPTPAPTPAPAVAALPQLPDPPTGQVYTPEIIGVAHRTLRCGTMLVLEYRGRTMTVPVIDRGPYIAGRTLDLSNATRLAIACPDLCTLSMRIAP